MNTTKNFFKIEGIDASLTLDHVDGNTIISLMAQGTSPARNGKPGKRRNPQRAALKNILFDRIFDGRLLNCIVRSGRSDNPQKELNIGCGALISIFNKGKTYRFDLCILGEIINAADLGLVPTTGRAVKIWTPALIAYDSTEAYENCMCLDHWRSNRVFVVESEKIVGITGTWPIAITATIGELHRPKTHPKSWTNESIAKFTDEPEVLFAAIEIAIVEATRRGWKLGEWVGLNKNC